MKKKVMTFAAILGIAALAAGCGSSNTDQNKGTTGGGQQAAGDIPAVYTQNCASCHGQKLEGVASFPKLDKIGAKLSEEQIKNQILKGGGAMPAFEGKLKPEEVTQLSSYLAKRK